MLAHKQQRALLVQFFYTLWRGWGIEDEAGQGGPNPHPITGLPSFCRGGYQMTWHHAPPAQFAQKGPLSTTLPFLAIFIYLPQQCLLSSLTTTSHICVFPPNRASSEATHTNYHNCTQIHTSRLSLPHCH